MCSIWKLLGRVYRFLGDELCNCYEMKQLEEVSFIGFADDIVAVTAQNEGILMSKANTALRTLVNWLTRKEIAPLYCNAIGTTITTCKAI
ncbi:hypothetical protein JTB14_037142 [Gonioctena quinquepunctata]|nr:hypothetical protein JTB14_037142 [Gonioctena quinquepunctata]